MKPGVRRVRRQGKKEGNIAGLSPTAMGQTLQACVSLTL